MKYKYTLLIALAIGLISFAPNSTHAQWEPSYFPSYRRINSLIADSSNIYAGGNSFFRSTDDGENWVNMTLGLTNNLTNGYIYALIKFNGIIFAGTRNGIYVTKNDGVEWSSADSGISQTRKVLSFLQNKRAIFAGTDNGLYTSTDNGVRWIFVGLSNEHIRTLALYDNDLFAGTDSGAVYYSKNNGENWIMVYNDSAYWGDNNNLAVCQNTLFLGTVKGVRILIPDSVGYKAVATAGINYNVLSFVNDSNYVYAGTDAGLYRSADSGMTWIEYAKDMPDVGSIYTLIVKNNILFAGTDRGIWKFTNNGINWIPASNGLMYMYVWSFASQDSILFVGADGGTDEFGMAVSINNGANWEIVPELGGQDVYSLLAYNGNIYAGDISTVYRSFDNGSSWITTDTEPQGQVISLVASDSMLFAGVDGNYDARGLFVSTDSGADWIISDSGLPHLSVQCLTVCNSNVFAAVSGAGVYRSTNNGKYWKPSSLGLSTSNVSTFGNYGSTVYVGTLGGGVFFSTDNGANWIPSNVGLDNLNVHSIAVYEDNVFVGTDSGGIFLSTDAGGNWSNISNEISYSGTVINAIFVHDDYVFVGTAGLGVWRRPLSDFGITSVKETNATSPPTSLTLDQNYPNPFNHYTNVRFQISQSGAAALKIYNALGQRVATLVSGEYTPGLYSVRWAPAGLQPGVYYSRLESGGHIEMKKLVLTE